MKSRSMFWSGVTLVAMSLAPIFYSGCSKPVSTSSPAISIPQEKKDQISELERKLREATEALRIEKVDYDRLNLEKRELERERNALVKERQDYPRNTPAEVIQELKEVRMELFKGGTWDKIGFNRYLELRADNREYRTRIASLTNDNEIMRGILLKSDPKIDYDTLTREQKAKFDELISPLVVERKSHEVAKAKLEEAGSEVERIRAERRTEYNKYQASLEWYRGEIARVTTERDQYKFELRRYNPHFVPQVQQLQLK